MIGPILQLMRRDVTRGVAGTILLKVGSGGLAFALFSLSARTMSPEAFGVFAAWLCVAQIGCVVGLVGQELVVVRFLNEYQVQERADLIKGVLISSLRISAVATLVAIAAIAAAAGVKGESGLLILAVAFFMSVNSGLMLGSQMARSLVSILMGEGNREFFWRVVVVLFLAGLLFGNGQLTPTELFTVMAAAMAVGLAVQGVSVAAALPGMSKAPAQLRDPGVGERARFSSGLLQFLKPLTSTSMSSLIFWMLDATTAGIYFAASRLANVFGMLSAALYTFAARRLPSLYFSKNHEEFEHTLVLMAEVTALVRRQRPDCDLGWRALSAWVVRTRLRRATLGADRAGARHGLSGRRRPGAARSFN